MKEISKDFLGFLGILSLLNAMLSFISDVDLEFDGSRKIRIKKSEDQREFCQDQREFRYHADSWNEAEAISTYDGV